MAKRVIVVGSGIIGASIAYHLAKSGAEVTVIEAGETGGLATRASWAWINASWGNPEPYFRLRLRSIERWHKLQAEIPALNGRAGARTHFVGAWQRYGFHEDGFWSAHRLCSQLLGRDAWAA